MRLDGPGEVHHVVRGDAPAQIVAHGLREHIVLGPISGPLSSWRRPQTALKCSCRSDSSVTRDGLMALRVPDAESRTRKGAARARWSVSRSTSLRLERNAVELATTRPSSGGPCSNATFCVCALLCVCTFCVCAHCALPTGGWQPSMGALQSVERGSSKCEENATEEGRTSLLARGRGGGCNRVREDFLCVASPVEQRHKRTQLRKRRKGTKQDVTPPHRKATLPAAP